VPKKCKIAARLILALLLFLVFSVKAEEYDENIDYESVVSADTFFVFGSHFYGILNLPKTPNASPYFINEDAKNDNQRIVLPAGEHRVFWSGGIEFESIDTVIEIRVGEISNVEFSFIERTATLFLETSPENASIFLDGNFAGTGMLFRDLRAGNHKITVSARGYRTNQQEITILPNRLLKMSVELEEAERGDVYYNNKARELRKLANFWGNFMLKQPFTVEVSALSVQRRVATNKNFRNLVSLFNDGPPIGTNFNGFSVFNKLWVSHSFMIASLEYGQGFGGLRYKKPYHIPVDDYILIYNEFREVNPEMSLRSNSAQIGIRIGHENLTIAVLTGILREEITMSGITRTAQDGRRYLSSQTKQNDNWITSVRASFSPSGLVFHPAFFAEIAMTPVNRYDVSGWINMRSGIIVPWRLSRGTD